MNRTNTVAVSIQAVLPESNAGAISSAAEALEAIDDKKAIPRDLLRFKKEHIRIVVLAG
ncbi:hypothetical protein [Rubellicoccus peritrichatus]|uniref:Uncharacterized protein n=1 Tax=Rubellicoccus peritrichatus TaxID=3080537 RepID=A0AAQ3LE89_9BACT|nr:hypothetical protein [Puniceicoccus sp. CR14]WOO41983.1 hypothetical protein RZN69_02705 [Puniceicoccus sp. CR14]